MNELCSSEEVPEICNAVAGCFDKSVHISILHPAGSCLVSVDFWERRFFARKIRKRHQMMQLWTPCSRMLFAAGRLGSMQALRPLVVDSQAVRGTPLAQSSTPLHWHRNAALHRQHYVRTYAATAGEHVCSCSNAWVFPTSTV